MIEVTQPRAAVNHPPHVGDLVYSRVTSAGIKLGSREILYSSKDFEGDPLTVLSVSSNTAEGSVDSKDAPNSYFFLPAPGFAGSTVLHFQVSDGHNTVIGKATINVIAPIPTCSGGQHLSADNRSCVCPTGTSWDASSSVCRKPPATVTHPQPAACATSCRQQHPHGNGRAYRTCMDGCR